MQYDEVIELRDKGELKDSLISCLELLSDTPEDPQARLLLSNIYYLLGCVELAGDELKGLFKRYPDKVSLKRLILAIDPSFSPDDEISDSSDATAEDDSTASTEEKGEDTPKKSQEDDSEEEVLAETDFEFDDLDLIEDD